MLHSLRHPRRRRRVEPRRHRHIPAALRPEEGVAGLADGLAHQIIHGRAEAEVDLVVEVLEGVRADVVVLRAGPSRQAHPLTAAVRTQPGGAGRARVSPAPRAGRCTRRALRGRCWCARRRSCAASSRPSRLPAASRWSPATGGRWGWGGVGLSRTHVAQREVHEVGEAEVLDEVHLDVRHLELRHLHAHRERAVRGLEVLGHAIAS